MPAPVEQIVLTTPPEEIVPGSPPHATTMPFRRSAWPDRRGHGATDQIEETLASINLGASSSRVRRRCLAFDPDDRSRSREGCAEVLSDFVKAWGSLAERMLDDGAGLPILSNLSRLQPWHAWPPTSAAYPRGAMGDLRAGNTRTGRVCGRHGRDVDLMSARSASVIRPRRRSAADRPGVIRHARLRGWQARHAGGAMTGYAVEASSPDG